MRNFIVFIKILKSKKKKLALSFVVLCQLRDVVELFKKSDLHSPIKIIHFLKPVRIQKCLT